MVADPINPDHYRRFPVEVIDGPRIYTTAADGTGIRREADDASVVELEKAGRKVFTTKGMTG